MSHVQFLMRLGCQLQFLHRSWHSAMNSVFCLQPLGHSVFLGFSKNNQPGRLHHGHVHNEHLSQIRIVVSSSFILSLLTFFWHCSFESSDLIGRRTCPTLIKIYVEQCALTLTIKKTLEKNAGQRKTSVVIYIAYIDCTF